MRLKLNVVSATEFDYTGGSDMFENLVHGSKLPGRTVGLMERSGTTGVPYVHIGQLAVFLAGASSTLAQQWDICYQSAMVDAHVKAITEKLMDPIILTGRIMAFPLGDLDVDHDALAARGRCSWRNLAHSKSAHSAVASQSECFCHTHAVRVLRAGARVPQALSVAGASHAAMCPIILTPTWAN
eukprot:gene23621-9148_t